MGPRPDKVAVVEEVRRRLESCNGAILTEYRGLDVAAMATVRRSLRQAGGEYKVFKNTLVRLAVREAGLESLQPLLEGPTAIAFAEGELVDVARALRDFARTNPALVVKGGLLEGNVLSPGEAGALADLPTRDVILSQLAGALAAPMRRMASLLQALPQSLAYGIRALLEAREAEPPNSAPPPAGTEPSEGGEGA